MVEPPTFDAAFVAQATVFSLAIQAVAGCIMGSTLLRPILTWRLLIRLLPLQLLLVPDRAILLLLLLLILLIAQLR